MGSKRYFEGAGEYCDRGKRWETHRGIWFKEGLSTGRRKSMYLRTGFSRLTKYFAEGTISIKDLKNTNLRKIYWAVRLKSNHARIKERSRWRVLLQLLRMDNSRVFFEQKEGEWEGEKTRIFRTQSLKLLESSSVIRVLSRPWIATCPMLEVVFSPRSLDESFKTVPSLKWLGASSEPFKYSAPRPLFQSLKA